MCDISKGNVAENDNSKACSQPQYWATQWGIKCIIAKVSRTMVKST